MRNDDRWLKGDENMIEENVRLGYLIYKYIERAMGQAEYRKLEDGDFIGKLPCCKGVFAFGKTLQECKEELLSTLKDWIEFGLSNDFYIPVINGIDLNKEIAQQNGVNVGISLND